MRQRSGAGQQVEFSSKADLNPALKQLAQAVEKKALEERDAAYQRMVFHELSCPTCQQRPG